MMKLPFECPICGHKKDIPQTNADRIRAMSDEELAEYVGKICLCSHIQYEDIGFCDNRAVCANCIVEWLRQPVEEVE